MRWRRGTARRCGGSSLPLLTTGSTRCGCFWQRPACAGVEAVGLRWEDVDLDAGRLRVVQTILSINGKLLTSEPKTAKGRRPNALEQSTVTVLREHRKRMLESACSSAPIFSDASLVIHRPDGSCLRPEIMSATFLRCQEALGLPRLTLKALRHTWATLALEQTIHPRVVQERLGHSTIAITLGIYSHVALTPTTKPPSWSQGSSSSRSRSLA